MGLPLIGIGFVSIYFSNDFLFRLIGGLTIFLGLTCIFHPIMLKRRSRKPKNKIDIDKVIIFDQNQITMTLDNKNSVNISYNDTKLWCRESNNEFVLRHGFKYIAVFHKDEITSGGEFALRNLLADKLGNRFKF